MFSIPLTASSIGLMIESSTSDGVAPMDTKLYAGLAHVVDGLEHIHGMVGTALADVPPPVRGLTGFRLIAESCLKHIRPVIFDPRETKGMKRATRRR